MPEAMEGYEEAITRRIIQDRQRDYVPLSTSMGDELERANRETARIARRTWQSPEHYVEDVTVNGNLCPCPHRPEHYIEDVTITHEEEDDDRED